MDKRNRIAGVFQIKRPNRTGAIPKEPPPDEMDKERIFARNGARRSSSRRSNKYRRNKVKRIAEDYERRVGDVEIAEPAVTDEDNRLYERLTGRVRAAREAYEAATPEERESYRRGLAREFDEGIADMATDGFLDEDEVPARGATVGEFVRSLTDLAAASETGSASTRGNDSLADQKSYSASSSKDSASSPREHPRSFKHSASISRQKSIDSTRSASDYDFDSASGRYVDSKHSASLEGQKSASASDRNSVSAPRRFKGSLADQKSYSASSFEDSASSPREHFRSFKHSASTINHNFIDSTCSASDYDLETIESASERYLEGQKYASASVNRGADYVSNPVRSKDSLTGQKFYSASSFEDSAPGDSASSPREHFTSFKHSASTINHNFIDSTCSASDYDLETIESASERYLEGQKSASASVYREAGYAPNPMRCKDSLTGQKSYSASSFEDSAPGDSASSPREHFTSFKHSASTINHNFIDFTCSASDYDLETIESASERYLEGQKSASASVYREAGYAPNPMRCKDSLTGQKSYSASSFEDSAPGDSASSPREHFKRSAFTTRQEFIDSTRSASEYDFEIVDSASERNLDSNHSASAEGQKAASASDPVYEEVDSVPRLWRFKGSLADQNTYSASSFRDSAAAHRENFRSFKHSASITRQKSIDSTRSASDFDTIGSASERSVSSKHSASVARQKSIESTRSATIEEGSASSPIGKLERFKNLVAGQKSASCSASPRGRFKGSAGQDSPGEFLYSARESPGSFRDSASTRSENSTWRKHSASGSVDSASPSPAGRLRNLASSSVEELASRFERSASAAEAASASPEDISESLGDELEDGAFFVEAYNDDGRELVIVQLSVDRKVIDLDSAQSIRRAMAEADVVFYRGEASPRREAPEYAEAFCSAFDEDDEGLGPRGYEGPVYNNVRRETFCDDKGIVRIERVGYPEKFRGEAEDASDRGDLERNDSLVSAKKLHYVIDELKTTERKYVEDLEKVIKKYIPYIERNAPAHLQGATEKIFGNIGKIYKKQKRFLDALERTKWDVDRLASCFIDYESLFDLYPNYLRNKPRADVLIREFSAVIKRMQEKYGEKLDFSAYLLTPLQRLGKYILFLEKILRELEKLRSGSEPVGLALDMMRGVMARGNDCVAIESIENSPISKMDYGSFIMREKFSVLKPRRLECVVFLFTDVVVFTVSEQKNVELFNYCDSIKMHHLRIASFEDGTIHLTDFPKTKRKPRSGRYTYVLESKSAKVRDAWREAIEKLLWQQLFREKEHVLKLGTNNDRDVKGNRSRTKSTGSAVFYVD